MHLGAEHHATHYYIIHNVTISGHSQLQIDDGDRFVAEARRNFVTVLVPADLENAAQPAIRLYELPILDVPDVYHLVKRATCQIPAWSNSELFLGLKNHRVSRAVAL